MYTILPRHDTLLDFPVIALASLPPPTGLHAQGPMLPPLDLVSYPSLLIRPAPPHTSLLKAHAHLNASAFAPPSAWSTLPGPSCPRSFGFQLQRHLLKQPPLTAAPTSVSSTTTVHLMVGHKLPVVQS